MAGQRNRSITSPGSARMHVTPPTVNSVSRSGGASHRGHRRTQRGVQREQHVIDPHVSRHAGNPYAFGWTLANLNLRARGPACPGGCAPGGLRARGPCAVSGSRRVPVTVGNTRGASNWR